MGKLTERVNSARIFHHQIMKPSITSSIQVRFRRNKALRSAVALCLLAALLTHPAHAQSAESFKVATPKTRQASKNEASAPAKDAKTAEIPHSRYIKPDDLPGQIQTLASVFTISKRTTDPFGQYQDPDAKPIIKTTVAKIKRIAPAQATPFSDIVRLIKVTTIMPADKSFLVGTRTIKQGDHIPLSFRGKNIKVEVAAVTSSAIGFRNLENGEQASIQLNLLPVGMTPGNNGITAPGMVPDRPDAPIELDADPL